MNKREFLEQLQQYLSDLPQQDVEQSLQYYAEMIDDRIEDGMTEYEAVEQIGLPEDAADRIRVELPLPTLMRAKARSARHPKAWEVVLLVLGSPVWLPILLSLVIIILSLYIVVWSLLLSLYVVDFALAASCIAGLGLSVWTIVEHDLMHGLFLLGASLVCGGFAILLFLLSKVLTKAVCRGTAAAVRKCKKRIAGKGNAS